MSDLDTSEFVLMKTFPLVLGVLALAACGCAETNPPASSVATNATASLVLDRIP